MSRATSSPRRRLLVSSLVVALAAGLAANAALAGRAAKQAQLPKITIGYATGGTIPTIGNHPGTASTGLFLVQLGGELAFHLTPDGVMHPWLVKSYKRIGNAGWTYHVREGVKFWDGTELTADDVAASWNWQGYGDTNGFHTGASVNSFFKNVDSVKATSKYHVLVTMKSPDATWKTVPSQYFMTIYEKKYLEAHKATFGQPGTLFVGTGPWMPSNFNPTSGVDWTANTHYWNKSVKIPAKKLRINFYSDEQGMALAARAGDIDLAIGIGNPKTFGATSGGWPVTTKPTCGVGMMSLPTQTAPFDDIHVRKAIAYALNRGDVLKATGGGAVATTNYLVSPSLLQILAPKGVVAKAQKAVPTYPFNLAKAKAELAQSAYPNGFSTSMVESDDPGAVNVSQVIAAQLGKIGINTKVQTMSTTAWFGVLLGPIAKRPFMFIDTGACQPDPSWEPNLFLGTHVLNEANWQPATVDALLDQGIKESKPATRLAAYVGINKAVNTDVPYVPLFLDGTSFASKKFSWPTFGAYWNNEPWALGFKPKGT